MAVTKTDFSLSAGFSIQDIMTELGNALANIGVMANATAWYDSYQEATASNYIGSEVRVVETTVGTGTYNTVYHCFTIAQGTSAEATPVLRYTLYADWNPVTHQSDGVDFYDHWSIYDDPYHNNIGADGVRRSLMSFNNVGPYTISAIKSNPTGNCNWLYFSGVNQTAIMGFILPTVSLQSGRNFNNNLPCVALGWGADNNVSSIVQAQALRGSYIGGGWVDSGSDGRACSATVASAGWNRGSAALSASGAGRQWYQGYTLWAAYPTMAVTKTTDQPTQTHLFDSTAVVTQIPFARQLYSDCHTGDMGMMYIETSAFTPANGDTIVVSSGVEEYFLLYVDPLTGDPEFNYQAIVARTV